MRSPDHLSISMASAIGLRLASGRFYRDARPTCANLLLTYPQTCLANCSYCGLARERPGTRDEKSFIRVQWPVLPTGRILEHLAKYGQDTKRICLSMVTHGRAYDDSLDIVARLRETLDTSLSVLVAPNLLDRQRLLELKHAGANTIGVGLDAASERVFERRRGRRAGGPLEWNNYWDTMKAAVEIFGPRDVNCHLVVGLGETDADLVATIGRLKSMGGAAYLFAFYPEADSRMACRRRPSLLRWRRLQLVKHLLEQDLMAPSSIAFDSRGRLVGLQAAGEVVMRAVSSGVPFMTDGCPDRNGSLACNRPFGSYRPGQPFRDYPFRPQPDDIAEVLRQLRLPEILPA